MTTATTQRNHPTLTAQLEQEAAEQRAADRAAAIAELAEVKSTLTAKIPPLRRSVQDAEAAFLKAEQDARKLIQTANDNLIAARSELSRVDRPLSARCDILDRQLTTELADPSIVEALQRVDRIQADNRVAVGQVGPERAAAISAWCISARENLTSLFYLDIADHAAAVDAIMDTQP